MTKTLTEQWREGTLPENTYYVQFICGRYGIYEFEQFKGFGFDNDLAYIKEVLSSVPSYDEWQAELDSNDELLNVQKRLEKKLAIATKALKEIFYERDERAVGDYLWIANNALKEMEGVK